MRVFVAVQGQPCQGIGTTVVSTGSVFCMDSGALRIFSRILQAIERRVSETHSGLEGDAG